MLLVMCPLTQVLQEAGSDDAMEYGELVEDPGTNVVKEEVLEGEVVEGEVVGEDEGGQVGPDY